MRSRCCVQNLGQPGPAPTCFLGAQELAAAQERALEAEAERAGQAAAALPPPSAHQDAETIRQLEMQLQVR